jgi:hypothetical protein
MSGFSASWLDLREPADRRARDEDLAREAAEILGAADSPVVVDLGAGTGATVRALSPLLARPARWRLVDSDTGLLALAAERGGSAVETIEMDLSGLVVLPFEGATMVTCSALLDLVSRSFLERMVASAASHHLAIYAVLSYDGTVGMEPVHALDQAVVEAFNRDQRRDKGFGPALGPDAARILIEVLHRAGYRVRTAETPWRLGPEDAAMIEELVKGIAQAVSGELDAEAVDDWLAFRLAHVDDCGIVVGHVDVLAVPG